MARILQSCQNYGTYHQDSSAFGLDDEISLQLVNPWHYMSKYLVIAPDRKLLPVSGAEIQWMWAIVNPKKDHLVQGHNFGLGIPNIGHITTTARTKGGITFF